MWRSKAISSLYDVLASDGILLLVAPNLLSLKGISSLIYSSISKRRLDVQAHTLLHYKRLLHKSGFHEVIFYALTITDRAETYPVAVSSLRGMAAYTYFSEANTSKNGSFLKQRLKNLLLSFRLLPLVHDTFLIIAKKVDRLPKSRPV